MANNQKFYINGVRETSFSTTSDQPSDTFINRAEVHSIGLLTELSNYGPIDAHMSQVYFIDGQALGPGYFGFTDPLTNTWRPKKFRAEGTTVNDGTVWSNSLTTNAGDNFDASGPKVDAFDGDSTDKCYTANNSDGTTQNTSYIQFNSPVVLNGDVEIYVDNGNAVFSVDSSGGLILLGKNTSGSDNQRVGLGYIQTSKLRVLMEGGSRPAIGAISVDGVIMQDSTTTNLAFGTNGFYLPMDGNSPIGQDKSGNGNNWTPVNFGSSVGLDKATGALPILNTVSGGNHATVGVRTDAYHANLVLAVPLVGNANDVSNSVNSGTTTKSVTVSGATASTAESNIYGGSFVFDGSNDEITVGGVSTDLDFGTGDYTAEAWFRLTATGDEYIISMGTDHGGAAPHWGINIYSTNLIRAGRTNSGGDTNHYVTHPFITNKWYHVAISRSGGVSRLFLDGNLLDEGSNTDDIDPTTDLKIGRYGSGAIYYNGYIQDVRIYKGIGKYTESFNPPSTSPDVLPDTPSGVSGGSKLTKITDGAVNFSASGDKLTVSNSSGDFDFGSGDFTIESYLYMTAQSGGDAIINLYNYSSNRRAWNFYHNSNDGNIELLLSTDGSSQISRFESNTPLPKNRWTHVAITKASNVYRMFFDGVQVSTTTVAETIFGTGTTADSVGIGDYAHTNAEPYSGFISNIRILKGTALYTSNFTPPTEPLTDVTNTKLLCCQSNTSAIAAAVSPGTITANGNAAATNFNPFNTDINTVRGQETGYCTLNPLAKPASTTYSNGNLDITTSSGWFSNACSIDISSGKWYYEFVRTSGSYAGVGWRNDITTAGNPPHNANGGGVYLSHNGNKQSSAGSSSYGATWTSGDVIGVAFDRDAGTITFYKNNVSQGQAFSGMTDGTFYPEVYIYQSGGTLNFGQKPFRFPPPEGFQPLNAANVRPSTVIARPDKYVSTVLWTGNSTARSIVTNNAPDFVWTKLRNTGNNHKLFDSVRGVEKRLESSTTNSESTESGSLTAFNSNGFSLGTVGNVNGSYNYVAWCWKAGGNKNTFNVDDVGYASASDVNMSVGALNSVSYDQSQTWSNSFTSSNGFWSGQGATKAFDGQGNVSGTNNNGVLTFSPNLTIPANSTIEVKCSTQSNGYTVTVNGVANDFDNSNVFTVVNYDGSTTLSTITIANKGSASGDLRGIKINGRLLVDNGVSVANVPSIANTGASVGTRQGFSIISFNSQSSDGNYSLSHGLNNTPKFIIMKSRTRSGGPWWVYHASTTDVVYKYLMLNSTIATTDNVAAGGGNIWGSSLPTSTTFGFTTGAGTAHTQNEDVIAYLWADVPGLQKFGQYPGNGSSDGPFVELGFRPAIILQKRTDSAGSWTLVDTTRDIDNPAALELLPNSSAAEYNNTSLFDILSNGFKVRATFNNLNADGGSFIYAAWAEAPTFNLYGGQSNAR